MAMPALQHFHSQHPDSHITILAKPQLEPLWHGHRAVQQTIALAPGTRGLIKTAGNIKALGFAQAFILPNSWRAALVPFLAGIPYRAGLPGHNRGCLLNPLITPPSSACHQQIEYAAIFGFDPQSPLPLPQLATPTPPRNDTPLVALFPGAARGPSKRWPADHFIAAARQLHHQTQARFLVLGTPAEKTLCQHIAEALAPDARSLAGSTSLADLPETLAPCQLAIGNDSGGMHLAAACGIPVVAIFGSTAPDKTRPLGKQVRCISPEGITGSRKIAAQDERAAALLASIPPHTVTAAALDFMTPPNRGGPRA